MNEIEHAKQLNDLATSSSIWGTAIGDFETLLDSRLASGLMNKSNGVSKRRVFNEDATALQQSRFLTGSQIAWSNHDHFKISDTDGTVLDLSDYFKVELRNASQQSFDTQWDETIIAMRKYADEEILENLHFRQPGRPAAPAMHVAMSAGSAPSQIAGGDPHEQSEGRRCAFEQQKMCH